MRESVTARDLGAGDVIHYRGSWWEVKHVVERAEDDEWTFSVIDVDDAENTTISLPPDEQVQVRGED